MKKAIERDLVFLDIETTGLDPDTHEIIEIAACRQANDFSKPACWVEHKTFPLHINTADAKALEINKYSADVWRDVAISLKGALSDFVMLCEGDVTLVIQNPTFDWGFIRPALKKFKLTPSIDYHIMDVASMMWPYVMRGLVESPSLEKTCAFWDISNEGAHGARRDVERLMSVYQAIMYGEGWKDR